MNPIFIETLLRDSDNDRRRFQSYRAFLLLWLLFESWLTHLSNRELTSQKITWFKNNQSYLKDSWPQISIPGEVRVLENQGQIFDKRFNPPRNPVSITNVQIPNVNEVVDVIYRIRCNLIHGHEDITNNDNLNLYSACGDILYRWLKWTYWDAHGRNLL